MAGYAALLLVALLSLQDINLPIISPDALLLALADIALLAGVYFMYVQIALIGAICFWCATAALLDLLIWLAALANWRLKRREGVQRPLVDHG